MITSRPWRVGLWPPSWSGMDFLHLLGAAKGLSWAQVSMMKEPISAAMGATWLAAAALVVAADLLLAFQARW
jgi:hypothetical protein